MHCLTHQVTFFTTVIQKMYLILHSQIIFMAQKYQGLMQKAKSGLKSLDSSLSKRVVPVYWRKVNQQNPDVHVWEKDNVQIGYKKAGDEWIAIQIEGSDEKTIGTFPSATDARYGAIIEMRKLL